MVHGERVTLDTGVVVEAVEVKGSRFGLCHSDHCQMCYFSVGFNCTACDDDRIDCRGLVFLEV